MKSFFSLFSDSSKELKNVSTLTVCGMLMAIAIVTRNLPLYITADLRITFSFFSIMTIAMLYGPVVCVIANVGVDVIGYFLDGYKARDYNFGLLAVKIIIALIYGIFLYKKITGKSIITFGIISRVIVVLFCNVGLNSFVLYYSYYNNSFPFMTSSEWNAFVIWLTPRIIKNAVMLPVEIVMICVLLPIISAAYHKIFSKKTAY